MKDGESKGTTRVIGESVSKTFKMSDNSQNKKNIKLLGIAKWNDQMFDQVIYIPIYILKTIH